MKPRSKVKRTKKMLFHRWLRSRSAQVSWRSCLRNVEWVTSQKLRRTTQWLLFYSELWSRERLQGIIVNLGRRLLSRRRGLFVLAATPAFIKDVEYGGEEVPDDESKPGGVKESIPDDLIRSHAHDLEYARKLTRATLTCEFCLKRHLVDDAVEDVDYCSCPRRKASVYGVASGDDGWSPFLERRNVLVWRREHPDHRGLYAYKMYGRFDDVTAKEFMDVQMDLSEFRMQWDTSTAQCHVVAEEEGAGGTSSSHPGDVLADVRQVYYWEVNWPKFFSNRDYVCCRRAVVIDSPCPERRKIVIYTRSSEHPAYPTKSKTYRVDDYVSVITISPSTDFDEEGVEFSLTAFENPGVSLPASVTTWVALRAMPELMTNLRKACLERRKWQKAAGHPAAAAPAAKEPSFMRTPPQRLSFKAIRGSLVQPE